MEKESEPEGNYLMTLTFLLISIDFNIYITFILLLLLIIASALLSGSEIAFFSISPEQIHNLENENTDIDKKILELREKPRKLLATILVGNNFINITIVLLSDYILNSIFGESYFQYWAQQLSEYTIFAGFEISSLVSFISFIITVLGVTFILVLFGEVMPKIFASSNNMKLAKLMANPLSSLMVILKPFTNILVKYTNLIEKRIEKNRKNSSNKDKDEIQDALDITLTKDEQELDILKSILNFNDVSVKQIMKPRMDVIALDSTMNFAEVLKIVKESGFSRIPVYTEDFDNIIGILFAKNLISHTTEKKEFDWLQLVRTQIYYVPESKKINEVLRDFQKQKTHMAIVVDEYGGTSGIVTMEDIMEEILGEILDEFDEEDNNEYEKIDDKTYKFEGKTSLIDFIRIFNENNNFFEDYKGEADSLAGIILESSGEIPEKGYEIKVNNYRFIVDSVTQRRIEKILVKLEDNDEEI